MQINYSENYKIDVENDRFGEGRWGDRGNASLFKDFRKIVPEIQ